MKTYSVCFLTTYHMIPGQGPYWVINWGQYPNREDLDLDGAVKFCLECGDLAVGLMYGHKSRNLVSHRNREIVWANANLLNRHKGPEVDRAREWKEQNDA